MPLDPNIPLQGRQPPPINPLADIMQVMQLRQAQQLLPLKIQEAQQTAQENALKLTEMQRQIDQRKALNDAYTQAVTTDDNGQPRFDRDKLNQALATAGHADQIPVVMESLDKAEKSRADLAEAQAKVQAANTEYGAGIGAATKAAGYDPAFFRAKIAVGVGNKAISMQTAGPILQELQQADQQDPTGQASKSIVRKYADALIGASEKMVQAQARSQASQTGAERLKLETPKIQSDVEKAASDAAIAEQKRTGTEPITPYQQAELNKTPKGGNPTEASLAQAVARGKMPGASVEDVKASQEAEIALKRLDQSKIASRPITNINMTPEQASTTAGMIAAGKVDPQTTRAMLRRQPGLIAQIKNVDPNFDEADLDKRYNTLKEFTNTSNSKAGGQALALNTLIHHADLYLQTADALKNGTFRPGNAVYNAVATAFGSAPPTQANLVAQFLAGETGKVATGGVPAEGEIKRILDQMSSSGSPAQMEGTAKSLLGIAAGRLAPLQERVKDAKLDSVVHVLGPDAQEILQRRGFNPETMKPANATGVAPIALKNGKVLVPHTQADADAFRRDHPELIK